MKKIIKEIRGQNKNDELHFCVLNCQFNQEKYNYHAITNIAFKMFLLLYSLYICL